MDVTLARRTWPNPLGRTISLVAVGCGLVAIVVAAGLALSGAEGPRWLALTPLVTLPPLVWLALRPAWSITIGNRGVGVRRLGSQRFVPRETVRGVRRPSGPLSTLHIETASRAVAVWPPPDGALELAAELERLSRRLD
jgi:hypothetical protein